MEDIFKRLMLIRPMSPKLISCLTQLLCHKKILKKDFLLKEGEVSNYIYHIVKGLVRGYEVKDEKEVSTWFMREGDYVISPISFFRRTPSKEFIIALEETEVLYISYAELNALYEECPEFNVHGRVIVQEYYVRHMEYTSRFARKTGEEKYRLLLEMDPDLVARVTDKDMASYLDLTPQAFSTIKGKMVKE